MKGIWRLLHWGPLTALSIIFVLLVCSVLADIVWFPPEDFYSIIHLTIFCFWVFLILKYFLKAAFIGPGLLPQQWYPASENEKQYLQFCIPCEGYKAPRAHHCRQCKRCVMKMDHHCPWINNCVGHKNHKSFTLFLLFVVIGCSHGTTIMSLSTWNHLIWVDGYLVLQIAEDDWVHMNSYMLLFFFFGIGLSVGVTVAVGVLLYYQVKSIIRNETGIEAWIVEKAARSRVSKEPFIYPYDLGFWKNIAQVMSFQDYVGDGIYWTIRDDSHQFALTVEQKEQKKLKRERMILHKVVSSYSGTWFPCRFGCKVCIDLPCSDDPRMAVTPNDNVYVTRWRKHWLYGEKVKKGDHRNGKWKREKGWFPRSCAMEVADEDIDNLNKQL